MRVAVLGFGPSGSAAAALLARRGCDVAVFDEDNRPPLIAGESLLPAIVPLLAKLGIENEVAALGIKKPGATFVVSQSQKISFSFEALPSKFPRYAYNVPRPGFDRLLGNAAIGAGARLFTGRAEVAAEGNRMRISPGDLEKIPSWRGRQPDLILDATGRRRVSAKLFGIPSRKGPRSDVAFFAHFERLGTDAPEGHVCINRLEHGWSWRIPLRGKTSFGIVLDNKAAQALGATAEERLETVLRTDPLLQPHAQNAERISEIATYANYQLVPDRGFGENWAAIGDAFGFVDPMLSPGMHLALASAEIIDQETHRKPLPEALDSYSRRMTRHLEAWMQLIDYFYDGRIYFLHEFGTAFRKRWGWMPTGLLEKAMQANLSSMASGFRTDSPFGQGFLRGFERFAKARKESCRHYAIS